MGTLARADRQGGARRSGNMPVPGLYQLRKRARAGGGGMRSCVASAWRL